MSTKKEQDAQKALAELKALHENGEFKIGDRVYGIGKMPFKLGRKMCAYLTVIAEELERGQLGFIDSAKFESEIEPLLIEYTLVDGMKLSTIPEHFDEYPGDFMQFVTSAIQSYAAPFMCGSGTNSPSQQEEETVTTLRKPM